MAEGWDVPDRFGDKLTERFANGGRVKQFAGFERTAERRLRLLMTTRSLGNLAAIPGCRLENLAGNRKGQKSIRINDQWRICFVWDDDLGEAFEIEITDYHD
jgi:proteic killer suppression protein